MDNTPNIPPIETWDWPAGCRLPKFSEIIYVASQCCDISPSDIYGRDGTARRDSQATIARHIAFRMATKLLGMSGVEVATALGVSSRSVFVSRRSSTYRLADSPAGVAMVNEATYCLWKMLHDPPVVVERRDGEMPSLIGDGDFHEAARRSLANHAGGAA